jgi:hypothetical protein
MAPLSIHAVASTDFPYLEPANRRTWLRDLTSVLEFPGTWTTSIRAWLCTKCDWERRAEFGGAEMKLISYFIDFLWWKFPHFIVAHQQLDEAIQSLVVGHRNVRKSLQNRIHFRHQIWENCDAQVGDNRVI